MELTLFKELKISIKKWEILYENPKKYDCICEIMPELSEYLHDCPLCQIYLKLTNHENYSDYEHINSNCPLYEEYRENGLLCCKDFHMFIKKCMYGDYTIAKEYALSILNKLKAKLSEMKEV